MTTKLTPDVAETRRLKILTAARWCFLNFGFAKTSLDDIAKRAAISRTLLYRTFKDKEDIFIAVFVDWLVSRHPLARDAVAGCGTPAARLLDVCRIMIIEPYAEMVGAPMASQFFDVCERLDPETEALHRRVACECVTNILDGNVAAAEVFLLALYGLVADEPTATELKQRVLLLIARFAPSNSKRKRRA